MNTYSELSTIASVHVSANGTVVIERLAHVLKDDNIVSSVPSTQQLNAGQDISNLALEPVVVNIALAAWSPAQITAAADKVLAGMRETAAAALAEQTATQDAQAAALQKRAAAIAEETATIERAEAGLVVRFQELEQHHADLTAQNAGLSTKILELAEKHKHFDTLEATLEQRRKDLHTATHAVNVAAAAAKP